MIPKINNIYTVNIGFYKGEKIILTWISPFKNIGSSENNRMTQAYGTLINNKKKINTILEFLVDKDFIDYKKSTKFELIKLIKGGDRTAKKEFIKRFKKVPKF